MSASVTARPRPPVNGGFGNGSDSWYGGGRGDGLPRRRPLETHQLGMVFALLGIGMLFVALTSSYVVRLGTESRAGSIPAQALVWVNSALLLVSSVTLEIARRNAAAFERWVQVTLLLGLAFIAGQLALWRVLAAQGIYLATNPHSSFFYLLTALHGLHLLGGIAALAYLVFRARTTGREAPVGLIDQHLRRAAGATTIYWHFLDGLWLYMVVLLFFWR